MECTRTEELLKRSLDVERLDIEGPPWSPTHIYSGGNQLREIRMTLFPGHCRWGGDFTNHTSEVNGVLREQVDVLITRFDAEPAKPENQSILAGIEFCGALPAGNNAWQRAGRAWSMGILGIPYLYVGELGGQELNSKGEVKAPRYPSPIVTGSFLAFDKRKKTVCLPLYLPSPTADSQVRETLKEEAPRRDLRDFLRDIVLEGKPGTRIREGLRRRSLDTIRLLREKRRRDDTLSSAAWNELLNEVPPRKIPEWFIGRDRRWMKKVARKTSPPHLRGFIEWCKKRGNAIGARQFPGMVLDSSERSGLLEELVNIFPERITNGFSSWITAREKPLGVAFLAGFKPRGQDSRPDRGILPTMRMILPLHSADILTVLYGPGPQSHWDLLNSKPESLAKQNGLWETIIELSSSLIVFSETLQKEYSRSYTFGSTTLEEGEPPVPTFEPVSTAFGEHDVDGVLHLLMKGADLSHGFEAMCNPPGGDWSGCHLTDGENVYRWSSLPRVSQSGAKRPDHVLQIEDRVWSIESKDTRSRLGDNLGPRLSRYTSDLFGRRPLAVKEVGGIRWSRFRGDAWPSIQTHRACVAFRGDEEAVAKALQETECDAAIGFEFSPIEGRVVLNVDGSPIGDLVRLLTRSAQAYGESIQIKS